MPLPLRLVAEPIIRQTYGTAFVLPSLDESKLCLVVADSGLLCVVGTKMISLAEISSLLCIPGHCIPSYMLTCDKGKVEWCKNESPCTTPRKDEILGSVQPLNVEICRSIISSIERYYAQQVLEPSIRGFLAILEKQFPRNDLYLFELLQNAVDDGSDDIIMESLPREGYSIHFCHNGRSFSPLDVLGLASVGLSTKGSGEKRKIGFMGVGFKAVYKRFAKVTVFDELWRFSFAEPAVKHSLEPSHSWVLKPHWSEDGNCTSQLGTKMASWCHFKLECPRGGPTTVKSDLAALSPTIPVLLARQALSSKLAAISTSAANPVWKLRWETTLYKITYEDVSNGLQSGADQTPVFRTFKQELSVPALPAVKSLTSRWKEPSNSDVGRGIWKQSYAEKLQCITETSSGGNKRTQLWQFIGVGFHPSVPAKEAYQVHTKKAWQGEGGSNMSDQFEQIAFFFPVDHRGIPTFFKFGKMHAVLPTKLTISMCMHIQASWLLSVDRQDVQSVSDNSWNNCLCLQIPRLLVAYVQWVAKKGDSSDPAQFLEPCYKLLPTFMTKASPSDQGECLFLQILDQAIDMSILSAAMKVDKITPVLVPLSVDCSTRSNCVQFVTSAAAMWVPPALAEGVPTAVLQSWFGVAPLASNLLGGAAAWHVLWRQTLIKPTRNLLSARRLAFRETVTSLTGYEKVVGVVALIAALQLCTQSAPPEDLSGSAGNHKTNIKVEDGTGTVSESMCGDMLPAAYHWPVFLTDRNENDSSAVVREAAATELVWLDPTDFTEQLLTKDIFDILRPAASFVVQKNVDDLDNVKQVGRQSNTHSNYHYRRNGPRTENPGQSKSVPALYLDKDIEKALHSGYVPPNSANTKGDATVVSASSGAEAGSSSHALACSVKAFTPQQRDVNLSHARLFLDYLRLTIPHRFVSSEAAARALLQDVAFTYAHKAVPVDVVRNLVLLFQWAQKNKNPLAVSHLLVQAESSSGERVAGATAAVHANLRLVKSTSAYVDKTKSVGAANSSGTSEDAWQSSLLYVSSVYVSMQTPAVSKPSSQYTLSGRTATGMSERAVENYLNFLVLCGAQSGISLVATNRPIRDKEIKDHLPEGRLPKLRSTATSINFNLPFNLGPLDKRKVQVVDMDFTKEWCAILNNASKNVATSFGVAELVCGLLLCADTAVTPTAKTTPYLDGLLKAKDVAGNSRADALSSTGQVKDNTVPPDLDKFPPAAWARMLYLPPGQAGASVCSLSPTAWVRRLTTSSWIPAAAPGASAGDEPTLVLRPCEVVLPVANASNQKQKGEGECNMPVARLSHRAADILLKLSPAGLNELFQWGTVKPPPPVDTFGALVTQMLSLQSASLGNGKGDRVRRGRMQCSYEKYTEVMNVWRSLCLAFREGRLTQVEQTTIKTLCHKTLSNCGSNSDIEDVSTVCIIPDISGDGNCDLVSVSHCVYSGGLRSTVDRTVPSSSSSSGVSPFRKTLGSTTTTDRAPWFSSNANDLVGEEEVASTGALVKVGFLFDVYAASSSNNYASQDNEKSEADGAAKWCMANVATELNAILRLPGTCKQQHCLQYVKYVNENIDVGNDQRSNYSSRSPTIPNCKAYSFALWMLIKSVFLSTDRVGNPKQPSDAAIAGARKYLQSRVPLLSVFCRSGPGIYPSPSAFPARWLPVWPDPSENIVVRPVLFDDVKKLAVNKGCGVPVSSLLDQSHYCQPLGMLDHGDGEFGRGSSLGGGTNNEYIDRISKILSETDGIVLTVLGIFKISNKKCFQVLLRQGGPAEHLEQASQCLSGVMAVLDLLHPLPVSRGRGADALPNLVTKTVGDASSVDLKATDSTIARAAIYKHTALELVMKSPNVGATGHGDVPAELTTTTVARYALLRPVPKKVAGGVETSGIEPQLSLVMTGNPDDYAPELEDIIMNNFWAARRGGSSGNANSNAHNKQKNSQFIRKACWLLKYIENEQLFLKHFRRHFAWCLPSTDVDTESPMKDANENVDMNTAEAEQLTTIKHESLVLGHLVESMTERVKLSENMNTSSKPRKRKAENHPESNTEDSNRPAKVLVDSSRNRDPVVAEAKSDGQEFQELGNGGATGTDPLHSGTNSSSNVAANNLEVNGLLDSLEQSVSPADLADRVMKHAQRQAIGAGRGGICNLPAWMTCATQTNESKMPADSALVITANNSVGAGGSCDVVAADDRGHIPVVDVPGANTVVNRPLQVAPLARGVAPVATVGTGRGRGIVNLPAWMTSTGDEKDGTILTSHSTTAAIAGQFDDCCPHKDRLSNHPVDMQLDSAVDREENTAGMSNTCSAFCLTVVQLTQLNKLLAGTHASAGGGSAFGALGEAVTGPLREIITGSICVFDRTKQESGEWSMLRSVLGLD